MEQSVVLTENLLEKRDAIKKQLELSSDADLEDIVRRLKRLYPASDIRSWLERENPLLRGQTPIQALREGRSEAVHHIVCLEEEGIGV